MFILLAQLLTYCTSSVAIVGKLLPVSYKELTGGKMLLLLVRVYFVQASHLDGISCSSDVYFWRKKMSFFSIIIDIHKGAFRMHEIHMEQVNSPRRTWETFQHSKYGLNCHVVLKVSFVGERLDMFVVNK